MGTPVRATAAMTMAISFLGCGSPTPAKPPPVINVQGPNGEILQATPPQRVSTKAPTYTKEACEAKVEGSAIANCTISTDGTQGAARLPDDQTPQLSLRGRHRPMMPTALNAATT